MPPRTPSKRRWGLGQIQRTQQITEQKEKEKNRLGVRYDRSVDTGLHIYKLGWRKAVGAKTESQAIRDGNDFFFFLACLV